MAGLSNALPPAPVGWAIKWHDRALALRDRLLSSARFQRWAVAFPLTRPVARRCARALFDLCAGFVYSQVLLACVRLRVFDMLAPGPQTVAVLSTRLGLAPDATTLLLKAAASLRLVEHCRDDRFRLGVLGAALLADPGIPAMVDHHPLLYADLDDPVALLRGRSSNTALARCWPYTRTDAGAELGISDVITYSQLMSVSQPLIAAEILAAYPVERHRCLLDVGGGDGTFLAACAARAPLLRLVLFDLPAVAELARKRFAVSDIASRATAVGGNFLSDPLPIGADLVSLVRVIHDHDDASALSILRAVRRVLPRDGVLLLAEPLSGTKGRDRVTDAYFAVYLLSMSRGRPRTAAELTGLLQTAGFGHVRFLANRTLPFARVVLARPAKRTVNIT